LGIGPNPQSPIPNPQSPIPNPQSPINNVSMIIIIYNKLISLIKLNILINKKNKIQFTQIFISKLVNELLFDMISSFVFTLVILNCLL